MLASLRSNGTYMAVGLALANIVGMLAFDSAPFFVAANVWLAAAFVLSNIPTRARVALRSVSQDPQPGREDG